MAGEWGTSVIHPKSPSTHYHHHLSLIWATEASSLSETYMLRASKPNLSNQTAAPKTPPWTEILVTISCPSRKSDDLGHFGPHYYAIYTPEANASKTQKRTIKTCAVVIAEFS